MENLGIFDDHLVYFTAIGNILWPFGIHIFPRFGILYQEKSGNPAYGTTINLQLIGTFFSGTSPKSKSY
jgi:hypothetical protein